MSDAPDVDPQPISGVSEILAKLTPPPPADPLFGRDDIRAAATKAWIQANQGTESGEAGFFVRGSPTALGIVPHPVSTNEYMKITDGMTSNTIAEVHVHPNRGIAEPSANDRRAADDHGIDIYTISNRGVYAYRPSRKATEFVGRLDQFLMKDTANK